MKPTHPKPFLKWPGGKTVLLPELRRRIPDYPGAYHEPFLGGGALFFALQRDGALDGRDVFLSDACPELANAYLAVRDRVEELIVQLDNLRAMPHGKGTFLDVAAQNPVALSDIERAARMVYLNKNAVNGIYRVNRSGIFNVPFNGGLKLALPSPEKLRIASAALSRATIRCVDFRDSLASVQPGDFAYLDPPYDGACFTEYTARGFKRADQEDLAAEFERLAQLGAFALLSNLGSDWVRNRYAAFHQDEKMVPRPINSNGKDRGPVPELLIESWNRGAGTTPLTALAPLAFVRPNDADAPFACSSVTKIDDPNHNDNSRHFSQAADGTTTCGEKIGDPMKTVRAFGKLVERERAYEIIVEDRINGIIHAADDDALRTILLEGWMPLDEWSDEDLESFIEGVDAESLECGAL